MAYYRFTHPTYGRSRGAVIFTDEHERSYVSATWDGIYANLPLDECTHVTHEVKEVDRRRIDTALSIVIMVATGLAMLAIIFSQVPVCVEEDSPNCIWFGPFQGNHQGSIVWNGDTEGGE